MKRGIILLLFILWATASADVSLFLREATGKTVFERNSSYLVTLQAAPTVPTVVGAIGEIYIEYDSRVFVPMTGLNTDFHALPHSIWDSEKISLDHVFRTDPAYNCIQYAKTDNNAVGWQLNTTQNIYTLRFRVRTNAPTGNTTIRFIYTPDNNRTKMISGVGEVIPIMCQDLSLYIDLDRTPPTTVMQPHGGLFRTIPQPRINISEDGLIHSLIVGGTWQQELVSENNWGSIIPIPGVPGQVRYTTVNYYGEDLALDKAHNIEATKTAFFIIDMEPPTITNVRVPTMQIPVGGTAEVWFNAYDQVGLGLMSLTIGGRPATYIGQQGVDNHFVYRRLIDGTEDPQGRVFITVNDTAGNTTTDNTKAVRLDFAGPYFYNITTTPVTPQINQEVIISFSASEELLDLPTVMVGNNPASCLDHAGLDFHYKYIVTGNGWYIGLDFLTPTSSPFTERNLSPKFVGDRPVNGDIYFRLNDSYSAINMNDLRLIVNNQTAYALGSFINGYTGRIFYMDGKPNIVCIPPARFPDAQTVTVQILVSNMAGNAGNEIYSYTVATYNDVTAPAIENEYPAPQAQDVSVISPISFRINDFDQAGVAIDRVNLSLSRVVKVWHKNKEQLVVTESVPVIVNGYFQPGFSGTLEPDFYGNLSVAIIPDHPLKPSTTYNCFVTAEDLAIIPQFVSTSWNFRTIGTAATNTNEFDRIPLAWPTVFDPEKDKKQYLTFSVPKDGEVTIRMYDLSGDMIWQYKYMATAGYQRQLVNAPWWDGEDSRGRKVGNGPYVWYIVQDKKVLGRGTSVIMR